MPNGQRMAAGRGSGQSRRGWSCSGGMFTWLPAVDLLHAHEGARLRPTPAASCACQAGTTSERQRAAIRLRASRRGNQFQRGCAADNDLTLEPLWFPDGERQEPV
jgi:hypothetical protein